MEDLPNEILLDIFMQLDRSGLKLVLNVCKRFRELILTSSILMRKLPLNLTKDWLAKIEFIGNFGEFVKEANFEYCSFESIEEIKSILNLLPNLEILKINYVYIKQTPNEERSLMNPVEVEEAQEFPNLRHLELRSKFWGYITQIDGKILKYLNTNRLEFLKIHLPMQKFSSDFIEFLCRQSNLKTLKVYDDFIDSFVFDDFVDFISYQDFISSLFEIDLSERVEFQLKNLSIHYRGDHKENFQKFLNAQSDLEELEICKYDDDFVKFKISFDLIRDFNVRKLSLYLDLLPTNGLNELDNFVNPSVHELVLMGYNNDPAMFNTLLRIFPNLKSLELEYMIDFSCDNLSQMKHLENLKINHFKLDCFVNVKIEGLKTLEITHLYPFVYTDFEIIATNHPKIEKFVVQEVTHFNNMCSLRNTINILVKSLKFLSYLKVIQIPDAQDCLKLTIDNRSRIIEMSHYANTFCKEAIEHLKNFHTYKLIKFL